MTIDPRDVGSPGEKEWQEFRASYSASFLFVWLLQESGESLEQYAQNLHRRFMTAWDIADTLDFDDGEERYVPLPNTLDDITDNVWISDAEARQLYEQLFPYPDAVGSDFGSSASGLAVIALHAALEVYARAVGADLRRTPLPKAVESLLATATVTLPAEAMRDLIEFDECRHLVVHNRGVVTERYVNNVPYNRLLEGELRHIGRTDLDRFVQVVWRTASTLHRVAQQ